MCNFPKEILLIISPYELLLKVACVVKIKLFFMD